MQNKECICKQDFRMNHTSFGWNIDFKKSQKYFYTTKSHDETGVLLYFVSDGDVNDHFGGVPFVESKFKKLFDNKLQDRDDKINKILND